MAAGTALLFAERLIQRSTWAVAPGYAAVGIRLLRIVWHDSLPLAPTSTGAALPALRGARDPVHATRRSPVGAVELDEVIGTSGTCRYFEERDIDDEVLERLLDAARFGPQGGNRQPVRFVVVRDAATKRQLRDWYLEPWSAYGSRAERLTALDLALQLGPLTRALGWDRVLRSMPAEAAGEWAGNLSGWLEDTATELGRP